MDVESGRTNFHTITPFQSFDHGRCKVLSTECRPPSAPGIPNAPNRAATRLRRLPRPSDQLIDGQPLSTAQQLALQRHRARPSRVSSQGETREVDDRCT